MEPDRTGIVNRIASLYGLGAVEIGNPQKGYRNSSYPVCLPDGTRLNIILYKHEAGILKRIQAANWVSAYLEDAGLPVRAQHDNRIVTLRSSTGVRYAALYNYLPGGTIAWEAYTMEHIKALGGMMGRIHALLSGKPRGSLPLVIDELAGLTDRMQQYFADPHVGAALRQKLGVAVHPQTFRYLSHVIAAVGALPSQPLHMDLTRGNVLFDVSDGTAVITGVLDFEKAAFGPAVVDIARTLAFLLVDCKYKAHGKVRKYFLDSGYVKRGECTLEAWQRQLVEKLVRQYLFHDFYKFLRHNPYESLHRNEHYKRTVDMLVQSRLVSCTTPL